MGVRVYPCGAGQGCGVRSTDEERSRETKGNLADYNIVLL